MQTSPAVAPAVFTLFDGISLLASIASLVLSVLAIWLTLKFKSDADKVNQQTTQLLTEIRSDAKAITQGVMSELRAYGESMRGTIMRNSVTSPQAVTSSATPDLHFAGNTEQLPLEGQR